MLPLFGAQQKRSALAALDKNVVMISVDLGFLPQYFRPGRNSLNSRYLSFFAPVHDKMTIFNQIEQAERLGGHRNAHSVFTCQSRFGKIHLSVSTSCWPSRLSRRLGTVMSPPAPVTTLI